MLTICVPYGRTKGYSIKKITKNNMLKELVSAIPQVGTFTLVIFIEYLQLYFKTIPPEFKTVNKYFICSIK
jgi:hypothetical protein